MQVHLHIGAYFTTTTQVFNALRTNAAQSGTALPVRRVYRQAVRALIDRLDGLPPIDAEEAELISTILGGRSAERMVLFDVNWASPLPEALGTSGRLYSGIASHAATVAELFSSQDLSVSMALRNPANFLQTAIEAKTARGALDAFLRAADPAEVGWLEAVVDLRAALPAKVPLTLWCEEDLPLIWPRLLRSLAGLPEGAPATESLLPLGQVMKPEGLSRLEIFLKAHPPRTDEQYERTVLAFLDKYALEEVLDPVCDIPGWDAAALAAVTERYEADVATLAARDDLTMILPVTAG
ncbi:hypothetical protein [Celeribacter indicus]|uniref:Uncharacterized protein n=1 Tax=Celeribacter indicus TaxID=1208324 RepID=A0A0B5DXN9_9RHOB|nr:hypothetical protein [Celeribacter indicus]AJE45511.1 hypothetical protein P73_0796 [Celeribacter indicus]SDW87143.1 hypothetical protein SAMN05443573_108139 [Celeribacter indicus]